MKDPGYISLAAELGCSSGFHRYTLDPCYKVPPFLLELTGLLCDPRNHLYPGPETWTGYRIRLRLKNKVDV